MEEIKVLIVDDRDIVRDGIKLSLLNSKSVRVEGEAADGLEAISLIKKNHYDVVLMDINMPNMNGIVSTEKMLRINPNVKVLASSFLINAESIYEMVKAGATGFIAKGGSMSVYEEAIIEVVKGAVFFSDDIDSDIYKKVYNYIKFPMKLDRQLA